MHTHNLFSPIIVAILISTAISKPCYGHVNQQYNVCNQTYSCGSNIHNIRYPFWGDSRPQYCGHPLFQLNCQNTEYPTVIINDRSFQVLGINQSHVMTIASIDLWDSYCTQNLSNITLDGNFFWYSQAVRDLFMFYDCTQNNFTRGLPNNFTCTNMGSDGGKSLGFYADESLLRALLLGNVTKFEGALCRVSVEVPVLRVALDELSSKSLSLQEALNQGFEVVYNAENAACLGCEDLGGICGSDSSSLEFVCHCRDHTYPRNCRGASRKMRQKLTIGASAAGMGMLLMCIIICCYRRKLWSNKLIVLWKKKTENDQNLESFIRHYKALAPKRYSYSDVKKITNSFRDKLGQGGYGCVYKGKLLDGRLVAVKILNASKGNGEEFINEVASISRTSHVNVVAFLGFCLEGGKRALIYELMPNGSLEKFIYGKNPLKNGGHLGLEKLYQIAIGIARGLEYLHRGCKTPILHFDIKPHNILLDEEFCPKISDFGLAKLCTTKESIVSMAGARGTIGYIAPEVFSRNFGGVSHKSDVYSYGMMVLEMVGGRRNVNVAVDHSSEICWTIFTVFKKI
ncbi:unnamed protein product [Camellia sinensis]